MSAHSSDTPVFRAMTRQDVEPVLQLIAECDDEEVEEAQADYADSIEDQFVFVASDGILGVTGFEEIEGTDRAYWLDWTFLDQNQRTPELGQAMMQELFAALRGRGARKLFIRTSDYYSGGLRCAHRFQRELYEAVGFQEEFRHADYYDTREAMIGLGLHFSTPCPADPPAEADERPIIALGVAKIPDSEHAAYLDWDFVDEPGADGISSAIQTAKEHRLRLIFASVASHATGARRQLEAAGLRHAGRWSDFHEDGLHDEQFRLDVW